MFLFVFVEKHFDNFYANFYSPKRRGEIERVMVASFLGRFQLLHFNWVIFAQECLFHEAISHFHLCCCCCCCHHPRAAKFQRNCSNLHKSKMFALILLRCDHYQNCRWQQHLHPSLVLSLSRCGLLAHLPHFCLSAIHLLPSDLDPAWIFGQHYDCQLYCYGINAKCVLTRN